MSHSQKRGSSRTGTSMKGFSSNGDLLQVVQAFQKKHKTSLKRSPSFLTNPPPPTKRAPPFMPINSNDKESKIITHHSTSFKKIKKECQKNVISGEKKNPFSPL